MTELTISKRLKKIANYLPSDAYFADIGSDHAYLPVYVCKQNETARAIAGELNVGPYQSAVEQVRKWNLADRIEVRLGDGLSILSPAEIEQIVIAGMGGSLITTILDNGKDKLQRVSRIIAQPNINARNVRKWFYQNGYYLVDECIMEEDGYHYEIVIAEKTERELHLSEKEYYLGPLILKNKNQPFYTKWSQVLHKKQNILEQMKQANEPNGKKITQFEKEIQWLKEELG